MKNNEENIKQMYKKDVAVTILDFLMRYYPSETFNNLEYAGCMVICETMYFILDPKKERYEQHSSEENAEKIHCRTKINLCESSSKEQSAVYSLLSALVKSTTGGELKQTINDILQTMPGWWSFFSTQRSLTMALRDIQIKYMWKDLLDGDLQQLKVYVNSKIKDLLSRIEKLLEKCKILEETNKTLKEQMCAFSVPSDAALTEAQSKIENLQSDKRRLLTELKRVQLEKQCAIKQNRELRNEVMRLRTINCSISNRSEKRCEDGLNKVEQSLKYSENCTKKWFSDVDQQVAKVWVEKPDQNTSGEDRTLENRKKIEQQRRPRRRIVTHSAVNGALFTQGEESSRVNPRQQCQPMAKNGSF